MATLQEVVDGLDALQTRLGEIDVVVEALYDLITQYQGQGITPEVAQMLLDKVALVRTVAETIPTDN